MQEERQSLTSPRLERLQRITVLLSRRLGACFQPACDKGIPRGGRSDVEGPPEGSCHYWLL